ncbi:MAG TPA: Gfo/Idh/MocA family oxidoreductase [Planctomycetota bacterium]|nr:Gfo/Idh/MocA family oxidoreductase [Planctomycetota bacterium]
MPTKYRLAVVGTGGISRYHMGGWIKSGLGQLVAACDIQPANLEGFCKEFGVPAEHAYADARQMLRREKPECVSICAWAQHHAALVVAACKAGVKGILCEKPMTYSIAEADAMRKAAEKSGAKLMITHQRRYSRRLTRARQLIARGAIGDVHTLVARGGGGLTNTHSHYVDMMRYVLGDRDGEWVLAQVERSTNRWERCHPVEDRLAALIGFEGGARGLVDSDTPLDGAAKGGMWLYGTKGAIDLFGGPLLMNASTGGKWKPIEVKREIDLPVEYVRGLVRWMNGGPEPPISIGKAWGTHEILMGIYESARTRTLVRLPVRNRRRILQQMIDEGVLPLKKRKPYDIRTPAALKAGYR